MISQNKIQNTITMNRRSFIRRATAIIGSLGCAISTSSFAAWKEGASLPDLSAFGLEGTLPKLKGKVVYLDFWASWCAPCKASFPVLDGWQRSLAGKGFTILAVSVDETSAAMRGFLKKNAVSLPVARDALQKLVSAANVSTMPSSFIIDRKGIIRHAHTGFHAKDAPKIEAQINALLAES